MEEAFSARVRYGLVGWGVSQEAGPELVDLLAIHAHRVRCGDTQADLVAFDGDDRHADVVVDDDFFPDVTCENQHVTPPWVVRSSVGLVGSTVGLTACSFSDRCEQ